MCDPVPCCGKGGIIETRDQECKDGVDEFMTKNMIETLHVLAILAKYSKGLLFTAATFQLRTLSRSPSSAIEPTPF